MMRTMSPPDPRAGRYPSGRQSWSPGPHATAAVQAPSASSRGGRRPDKARRSLDWKTLVVSVLLGGVVLVDVALLLVALVPDRVWQTHGYPNGPIPHDLTPIVAAAFYVLPAVIGALCRRWQVALVLATLPAWLDLGLFATAAASRIGPFYLFLDVHAASTVGTLELFGALGALGWLARTVLLMALGRGEWGRR